MLWRLKYDPLSVFAQRLLGVVKAKTTHPIVTGRRVKAWIPEMYGDESHTWTVKPHWEYATVGRIEPGKFEVTFDYCSTCKDSGRQTHGLSCWAFEWDYGGSEIPV